LERRDERDQVLVCRRLRDLPIQIRSPRMSRAWGVNGYPVGIPRPRESGSGRSDLVVGASRAALLRQCRRWATPRNEIVS